MKEYPVENNILGQLARDRTRDFGKYNLEACSICRELDHGKNIIDQSENFSCFPDIGQIMEGYVQIVTRKHQLSDQHPLYCYGHIPKKWSSEYHQFVSELDSRVKECYGETIHFEHGEYGERKRKGGKPATVHMHLHIVPSKVSILKPIREGGLFSVSNLDNLDQLLELTKSMVSYYYYKDIDGEEYLLTPKSETPSQVMRRYLNDIPWVREENRKWLDNNNYSYSLEDLWECMLFRPADRFKRTVRRLKQ